MEAAHEIATSVSALMGASVLDGAGNRLGRVHEFVVNVTEDGTRVAGLVLHRRGKQNSGAMLAIEDIDPPARSLRELRAHGAPRQTEHLDRYLLLERDLLDQQIIDVDGRKVVRVNDVNLVWEPAGKEAKAALRIDAVEVGLRGAARRLLKGLPNLAVDSVTRRMATRGIPWSCVDLIDRDPARRVRLKVGQDRLAKLHPSDIADILENLAPSEREAVFTSLPEETAAEALEEIEPRLQKELLRGLNSERAADIIEEMDPGAAADLLHELSDEQSEAILEEMEPDERHEIEELLEFSPRSAAGRMTTDVVSVSQEATVGAAIDALREFWGDSDTITELYLLGSDERLAGVVPLARLLLAAGDVPLLTLSEVHNVSCPLSATDAQVAELFDKYNLRSLPVLDRSGRVAGAIHAEQVIAQLREA